MNSRMRGDQDCNRVRDLTVLADELLKRVGGAEEAAVVGNHLLLRVQLELVPNAMISGTSPAITTPIQSSGKPC